ncbi:MAG: hypothetical protein ACR2PZ_00825 [Pseudomonadales bacterium]
MEPGTEASAAPISVASKPTANSNLTNPSMGTGQGTFILPGERFEFAVTDCSTQPYQFGGAKYHISFTGHGTSSNGRPFNISGHHATGSDGKGPLDRQTILLGEKVADSTPPQTIPGTNMTMPTQPRLLERTNYFRAGEGWMRAGGRASLGEGPILTVDGNLISGRAVFSGAPSDDPKGRKKDLGEGELHVVCNPLS